MEFPFGHNHSHTHHHRNDDEENPQRAGAPFAPPPHHHQPPPPPSYFQRPEFAEPPPPSYQHHHQTEFQQPPTYVTHVHHSGGAGGGLPHEYGSANYSPPPPPSAHVTHVSHERIDHHQNEGHHFRPHLPSFPHHHQPHSVLPPELSNKPTVKVYCKADPNYHLSIRDGKVILAPADPSDQYQHWIKDEKFSTRVKDEVGFPSFALVNKVTGEALKHSIGATHPVQLTPYKPDHVDESVLWSESKDTGEGYRAIRMINNIRLNFDAFNGNKKHGGVHNGTTIVLWEWKKGDNQQWKIVPYCKFSQKLKIKIIEALAKRSNHLWF